MVKGSNTTVEKKKYVVLALIILSVVVVMIATEVQYVAEKNAYQVEQEER